MQREKNFHENVDEIHHDVFFVYVVSVAPLEREHVRRGSAAFFTNNLKATRLTNASFRSVPVESDVLEGNRHSGPRRI